MKNKLYRISFTMTEDAIRGLATKLEIDPRGRKKDIISAGFVGNIHGAVQVERKPPLLDFDGTPYVPDRKTKVKK